MNARRGGIIRHFQRMAHCRCCALVLAGDDGATSGHPTPIRSDTRLVRGKFGPRADAIGKERPTQLRDPCYGPLRGASCPPLFESRPGPMH
jgi:hypothetical protein